MIFLHCFFFFKQKTAYEMRISDWSSDVCSSDLTSLTVPGIRYVIDSGTARISRYSYRAKVQRLPIEAISQASANQRKGRCGRVEPGICVRLYSEEDFLGRPEFTDQIGRAHV